MYFHDFASGKDILLSQAAFIEEVAYTLMDNDETIITQYHRALAVNILANSTRTGRAAFLYGMMP